MRKYAAQSGAILSQFRAKLFAERSATDRTPITRALRLSPSYQTLACTKEFAESVCKNSPRKSVYAGVMSKLGRAL